GREGFNLGTEYIHKQIEIVITNEEYVDGTLQDGNAFLVNLSYNKGNFGTSINLRRMENMSFYSDRKFAGNQYNKGIINYIPALTKQYDFSLQNIYVYQAQGGINWFEKRNGEIGGQYDFYYDFVE